MCALSVEMIDDGPLQSRLFVHKQSRLQWTNDNWSKLVPSKRSYRLCMNPVLQIGRSLRTQALAQLFNVHVCNLRSDKAQTCISPKCLIYWIVASCEEEIIVKWIGLPSSSLFFFFLGLPSSFSNSCATAEDLGTLRYQQQLPVVEISRFVNKGTQRHILRVKETVLNVWQLQRRRLHTGRKCTNYL